MTISPLQRYQQELQKPDVQKDPAQAEAMACLQKLWLALEQQRLAKVSLVGRLMSAVRRGESVRGIYFWGGVGRGKTWLMDIFYECLPFDQKMRTHFHRFMRRVHQEMKGLPATKNPLQAVAALLAKEARVICLDEFFVADITDAMILANLLDALFTRGVTLVVTSNVYPDALYREGLQRSRFLPAIALLHKFCSVVELAGPTDYRLRVLEKAELYYSPVTPKSRDALEGCFARLAPDNNPVRDRVSLNIEGRAISVIKESEGIVWFEFSALCDGPRSQNDYIELAREYHSVIIEGIPVFTADNNDQARRFINLVDEFYDRGVKLIVSAECAIPALYKGGGLAFEFARTQSRLQEMQSHAYLARAHSP